MMLRSLLALMLFPTASLAGTPAQAILDARADIAKVVPAAQPYQRYFWLEGTEEDHKKLQVDAVFSYHCNHLSREPDIEHPVNLGNGLWKVDLRWFRWDVYVFAAAADKDVSFRNPGVRVSLSGQSISSFDPNCGSAVAWAELVKLTCSQYPIANLGEFVHLTAIQADREGHGYYDFLGLGKKEKDFQDLIGADPKLAKKLKLEMAASVAKSSVTLNNRSMTRLQAITGGYWFTQDYKTSQGKQNTVRLLDGDAEPPAGDASEQYGVLPNRLFAFWLQNGKGERQDSAPDFIASDSQAHGTDRRVHVGLGCVRCHTPGLQGIDDWSRRVLQNPLGLQSVDYDKYKRLKQLYLSDLEGQLAEDNAAYAKALKRCNGLTPAANAKAYADFFAWYERDYAAKDIAKLVGCTEDGLLKAVRASAAATGYTDLVMAGLLADPPVSLRWEHVEELMASFRQITKTYGK